MEGFTYTNIFETKGIEYLAIITFFAILVPFWLLLNRQVKITLQIQKSLDFLTAGSLRIPQGLFFSRFHAWTHLEKSGLAKVGPDDFLMKVTGEVKVLNLRKHGEHVSKGDILATISQNDKMLHLYSPISGRIVESNDNLIKDPAMLSEDPYSKGWLYKIKPENWVEETNAYYLAEGASKWAEQEIVRLRDFLATAAGNGSSGLSNIVLQDGGELCAEPLAGLPGEIWQAFQEDFLDRKSLVPHMEAFSVS
jgi:glycine cleavage system H protein